MGRRRSRTDDPAAPGPALGAPAGTRQCWLSGPCSLVVNRCYPSSRSRPLLVVFAQRRSRWTTSAHVPCKRASLPACLSAVQQAGRS